MNNSTEPTYRRIEFEITLDGNTFFSDITMHQDSTIEECLAAAQFEIERQIEEGPDE